MKKQIKTDVIDINNITLENYFHISDDLNKKSIIDIYFAMRELAKKKYGEKVFVLIGNGSFSETTFLSPEMLMLEEDEELYKSTSEEMKILLDELYDEINEFQRLNPKYSVCVRDGIKCFGIPMRTLETEKAYFINEGYVLVLFKQAGEKINGKEKRIFDKVYTPSTMIVSDNELLENRIVEKIDKYNETNNENIINLMTIYISKHSIMNNEILIMGIAIMNMTNGETHIYEIEDKQEDTMLCYHEINKLIKIFGIYELIIFNSINEVKRINEKGIKYNEVITEETIRKNLTLNSIKRIQYINTDKSIDESMDKSTNKTTDNFASLILKTSYKTAVLEKVYMEELKLNPYIKKQGIIIDWLGLTPYQYGTTSFIILLDYIKTEVAFYKNITKPKILHNIDSPFLQLHNEVIDQLDIIHEGDVNKSHILYKLRRTQKAQVNSLFSIINKTSNILGKRLLKERLLMPIVSNEELNMRYDNISKFISIKKTKEMKKILSGISDISTSHRKILMGRLPAKEFKTLRKSYSEIEKLIATFSTDCFRMIDGKKTNIKNSLVEFGEYLKYIDSKIKINENVLEDEDNEDENTTTSFDISIVKGNDNVLDELLEESERIYGLIQYIIEKINEQLMINKQATGIKFKITKLKQLEYFRLKQGADEYKIELIITKTKYKTLMDILKKKPIEIPLDDDNKWVVVIDENSIETRMNKSYIIIAINNNPEDDNLNMEKLTDSYNKILTEININIKRVYKIIIEEWSAKYKSLMEKINIYVSEYDFYNSAAEVAIDYKYNRPELMKGDKSGITVEEMRHPIVERISNEIYVPHNLSIGEIVSKKTIINDSTSGVLIYGINCGGKTILMKSLGLNIIMAQAGLFVPCKTMKLIPYKSIFSRIDKTDNLYNAQSLFHADILDLNYILERIDKNSLVLADEALNSTEWKSAVGLVSSIITKLITKNATFIFTTHFHELLKVSKIMKFIENKQLGVYHIKFDYDNNTKTTDRRKLLKGNGGQLYGIEMADLLGVNKELICDAFKARRELNELPEHFVNTKSSVYNNNVYMDVCVNCGKKAEDCDHIIPQKDFNDEKHFDKNILNNLQVLCKECHKKKTIQDLKKKI